MLQGKYEIKALFLVMSKVDSLSVANNAKFDRWTDEIDEEQLLDICKRIAAASSELKAQCDKAGIASFDLATDYEQNFRRAYDYLVG